MPGKYTAPWTDRGGQGHVMPAHKARALEACLCTDDSVCRTTMPWETGEEPTTEPEALVGSWGSSRVGRHARGKTDGVLCMGAQTGHDMVLSFESIQTP